MSAQPKKESLTASLIAGTVAGAIEGVASQSTRALLAPLVLGR
jgi:hypothetical protein